MSNEEPKNFAEFLADLGEIPRGKIVQVQVRSTEDDTNNFRQPEIKENTHLVLKREHIANALTPEEYLTWLRLEKKIQKSISPREYLVINRDEPYAQTIQSVILEGEYCKQLKLDGIIKEENEIEIPLKGEDNE